MKRQNGTGVWIGAWGYGGLYFQYYASVIRQLNVTVFKSQRLYIAIERLEVSLTRSVHCAEWWNCSVAL